MIGIMSNQFDFFCSPLDRLRADKKSLTLGTSAISEREVIVYG